MWYKNEGVYRKDGPACIFYNENEEVTKKEWHENEEVTKSQVY
jgi:hypothetical protein